MADFSERHVYDWQGDPDIDASCMRTVVLNGCETMVYEGMAPDWPAEEPTVIGQGTSASGQARIPGVLGGINGPLRTLVQAAASATAGAVTLIGLVAVRLIVALMGPVLMFLVRLLLSIISALAP